MDVLLAKLEQSIKEMGKLVEEIIAKAMYALVHRKIELASEVITDNGEIDLLEIHTDRLCLELFKKNPTEAHLRSITSVARTSATLARMGDLAVNIAERARYLSSVPPLTCDQSKLEQMSVYVQDMVHSSITAFLNRDAVWARRICSQDDQVDALNKEIFEQMEQLMQHDSDTIRRALHYLLIARHLERTADLATDICEDVVFMVEGKTIKHNVEEYRGT